MAAQKGNLLLVKQGNGMDPEVFTTLGDLRTKNFTLSGNKINITTDSDVDVNGILWMTNIAGAKEFEISGSGISKSVTQVQQMMDDFLNDTVRNYELVIPNAGTFTVQMQVGNFSFSSETEDVINFDLELYNTAKPTFVVEVVV